MASILPSLDTLPYESIANGTKQTKNRTETQKRGPESCSALFLEQAAAFVEGDGSTILQLNVEDRTNAKLTIIEQLAYTNKVTATLLQEANYPVIQPSCIHLELTTWPGCLS